MPRMGTSSDAELLLELDRTSDGPLHHQLEQGLRAAVRSGRLAAGSALPSSRSLAAQLGVARGVVVEAYEQLAAEGYLVTRPGGSTRVASVDGAPAHSAEPVAETSLEIDFRPGRPDLIEFPRAAWARSFRRALASAPADRLGYLDGHGVPELRAVLSAYLDRVRGTSTDPADIVVCAGFVQGLQLVASALRRSGARRVAVEDPWHADYRRVLHVSGLEIVPVPVDDDGLDVERLAATDTDLLVLTPAHQYPSGAVLSASRRAAILEWAADRDALVMEDDYDAEFRYDREPIGAMQGLAPERVIYAGTTSKTLAPGLRLGWLAVPRELSERIARAKVAADYGSGALDQLTLADFMERGSLDRHLRRMRAVYRGRRDALLTGLELHLPGVRPTGASAGLHVLARLPGPRRRGALRRRGCRGRRGHRRCGRDVRRSAGKPGVIFGYAAVGERRIEPGLERLASLSAWPGSR